MMEVSHYGGDFVPGGKKKKRDKGRDGGQMKNNMR